MAKVKGTSERTDEAFDRVTDEILVDYFKAHVNRDGIYEGPRPALALSFAIIDLAAAKVVRQIVCLHGIKGKPFDLAATYDEGLADCMPKCSACEAIATHWCDMQSGEIKKDARYMHEQAAHPDPYYGFDRDERPALVPGLIPEPPKPRVTHQRTPLEEPAAAAIAPASTASATQQRDTRLDEAEKSIPKLPTAPHGWRRWLDLKWLISMAAWFFGSPSK